MKRQFGFNWYHGWNIVAAGVFGQILAQGIVVNCFSLFLGEWSREFKTPISSLTLGISLFALGSAIMSPFSGWASDRFSARKVFGFAFSLIILTYACFGLVTAAWQILAIYGTIAAIGCAFGGAAPTQAAVSRWFVHRRGLAMGITATGIVLAGVLFPPLVSALIPIVGWRMVWWIFGAFTAVVAVPIILTVMRHRPGPKDSTAYLGPQTDSSTTPTITYREMFSRPNFWIIAGSYTFVYCGYIALLINLAPLVMSRGYSRGTAGLLLSVLSVAALASKVAMGLFTDRFGNRRAFMFLSVMCMAGVAMFLVTPSTLATLTAGLVLVGISSGAWTPLATAVAVEFGPANFGRVFGVMIICSPISVVSGTIFAKMKEATGSYDLGLLSLIGCGLVAGVIGFFLKEKTVGNRALAPSAA